MVPALPGLFYVEKYVINGVIASLFDGNHAEKHPLLANIKLDEQISSIDDMFIVISGQVTILVEYTYAGV